MSKANVKTVVIVNDFNNTQGGASKVAIDTANLVKKYYPELKVYFFSGSEDTSHELNNAVIDIHTGQGECLRSKNRVLGVKNGIYNQKAKNDLKRLLQTLDPATTVIHFHGWTKSLSSSVFDAATKLGFTTTLTMHDYFTACPNGGYFNYPKNCICPLTPLSGACIRTNCDSRNYAFKLYRVLRQKRYNQSFRAVKNYISISDFSEKILRRTLPEDAKVVRINNPIDFDSTQTITNLKDNSYYLYVGRISKEKGVETFCKAITNLGLKGIAVGDGEERPRLEAKYPNIKFVGWKTEKGVTKRMLGARALIFPSLWYEGAPLTPVKALATGLPVFTTDCNSATDIITDKNFIFRTEEELEEKLKAFDKKPVMPKVDLKLETKKQYAENIVNYYNNLLGEKNA